MSSTTSADIGSQTFNFMADNESLESIYMFAVLNVILALFLIFYFFFSARLLGWGLSFVANALIGDGGQVRMGSIHMSLIGGQLILRDVVFCSKNVYLRVVDAVIGIQWWKNWATCSSLLLISFSGLEYCILNNAANYDKLEALKRERERKGRDKEHRFNVNKEEDEPGEHFLFWLSSKIKLHIDVGCIMIGNSKLPTMLVTSFNKATGHIARVSGSSSSRTEVVLSMHDASIKFKKNSDCVQEGESEGELKKSEHAASAWTNPTTQVWKGLREVFKDLPFFLDHDDMHGSGRDGVESKEEDHTPSKGGEPDLKAKTSKHRWGNGNAPFSPKSGKTGGKAKEEDDNVLKSQHVRLKYYDDTCQIIRGAGERQQQPEAGLVLDVVHGSLVYGPWEERQLKKLRQFFYPPDFQERTPYEPKVGELERKTGFRLNIYFKGSIRLKVPYAKVNPGRRRDPLVCYLAGESESGWLSLLCGTPPPQKASRDKNGERIVREGKREGSGGGGHGENWKGGRNEDEDDDGDQDSDEASSTGGSSLNSYFEGSESDDDDEDLYGSVDGGDDADGDMGEAETGTGIESLQTVGMVRNFTPWVVSERGYDFEVEADFLDSVISSSIPSETSAGAIWSCEALKVCVSQHGGLKFNDPQSWGYEIIVSESDITLLRDHIRLVVDLIVDWQWQNAADKARAQSHQLFVPCIYKVNLTLHSRFSLSLVTSEHNVVEDYADPSQTSYIVASGTNLAVESRTKSDRYQPPFGETVYTASTNRVKFATVMSPIDSSRPGPERIDQAVTVDSFRLKGSYVFQSRHPSAPHVEPDISTVTLHWAGVRGVAHGTVITQVGRLIGNYFGETSSLITRKDYNSSKDEADGTVGWNFNSQNLIAEQYANSQEWEHFEAVFRMSLTDVCLSLPESLLLSGPPSAEATTKEVLLELRSVKTCSDLSVSVSPIFIEGTSDRAPSGFVRIDGASYHTHAFFGRRPASLRYRDFVTVSVKNVTGTLSPELASSLTSWGTYAFPPRPRLPSAKHIIPGSLWQKKLNYSTLKGRIGVVTLSVTSPSSVAHVRLPDGVRITGDNMINSKHRSQTTVLIRSLEASMHRTEDGGGSSEVARVTASFEIVLRTRYSEWEESAVKQWEFLRAQDKDSKRLGDLKEPPKGTSVYPETPHAWESSDAASNRSFPSLSGDASDYATANDDFVTAGDVTDDEEEGEDGCPLEEDGGQDVDVNDDYQQGLHEMRAGSGAASRRPTSEEASSGEDNFPFLSTGRVRKAQRVRGGRRGRSWPHFELAPEGTARQSVRWGRGVVKPKADDDQRMYACEIPIGRVNRGISELSTSSANADGPAGGGGGGGGGGRFSSTQELFVENTTEVRCGPVSVAACPHAAAAVLDFLDFVPPQHETVEGCVRHLMSRYLPQSYCFLAPHQVRKLFKVQTDSIEIALLQTLPSHSGTATSPSRATSGSEQADSCTGHESRYQVLVACSGARFEISTSSDHENSCQLANHGDGKQRKFYGKRRRASMNESPEIETSYTGGVLGLQVWVTQLPPPRWRGYSPPDGISPQSLAAACGGDPPSIPRGGGIPLLFVGGGGSAWASIRSEPATLSAEGSVALPSLRVAASHSLPQTLLGLGCTWDRILSKFKSRGNSEMTARNLTLMLELAVPHSLEARAKDIAVFGTRDDLAVESDKFRLPSTRWRTIKSGSGRAMTQKATLKKKESSMRGKARSVMLRSLNEPSSGTFLDRSKGITSGRKGLRSVLSSRAPSSVAAGMLGPSHFSKEAVQAVSDMLCVFKFARSLSEEDRAALDEAMSLPLEHIIVSHRTGNLISCPKDESGVDSVTAFRFSVESFVLVVPHPAVEDTEAGPKKGQESVLRGKGFTTSASITVRGIPADSAPDVVVNGQGGIWDVNILPPLRDFIERLTSIDAASAKSQCADAVDTLFCAASVGKAGSGVLRRTASFGRSLGAGGGGAPMFPGREKERRVTVLVPLKHGLRSCTSLFAKQEDDSLTEPILCNVQSWHPPLRRRPSLPGASTSNSTYTAHMTSFTAYANAYHEEEMQFSDGREPPIVHAQLTFSSKCYAWAGTACAILSFESGLITYDQLPHPQDEGSYYLDHTPMRSVCLSLSTVSLRHISETIALAEGIPASEITSQSIRINLVNEKRSGRQPQIAPSPTSGGGMDANWGSPGFSDAEEADLGRHFSGGGIKHGGDGTSAGLESPSGQKNNETATGSGKNASFEAGGNGTPGSQNRGSSGGGKGKKKGTEKSLKEVVIGGIHFYQGILVQVTGMKTKAALHLVDGKSLSELILAWSPPSVDNADDDEDEQWPELGVLGGNRASFRSASVMTGSAKTITLCVTDTVVNLEMIKGLDLQLTNSKGSFISISQYSSKAMRALQSTAGRARMQTEICLKVNETNLSTTKTEGPGGEPLSAAFDLPGLRAAGTMKARDTKVTEATSPDPKQPPPSFSAMAGQEASRRAKELAKILSVPGGSATGDIIGQRNLSLPPMEEGDGREASAAASAQSLPGVSQLKARAAQRAHMPSGLVIDPATPEPDADIPLSRSSSIVSPVIDTLKGAGRRATERARSITDVQLVFSVEQMSNEVREDMLNSLLELQRTMSSEIATFLAQAEDYARKISKRRKRDDGGRFRGVQFHFHLIFLLEGILLSAAAPGATLLLDTGFFTLQMEGSESNTADGKAPSAGEEHKESKLKWKVGLEGLSIATLSHSNQVGAADKADNKAWMLANLRTNLQVQNQAGGEIKTTQGGSKQGRSLSNFELVISKTELLAHPGSIACLTLLWRHYLAAYKDYRRKRMESGLTKLDSSFRRLAQTGSMVAQGHIKETAPKIISSLHVNVRVQDTTVRLIYSGDVSDRYSYNLPSSPTAAQIFSRVNIRSDAGFQKEERDDKALVAALEIVQLRITSSQDPAYASSRTITSRLDFGNFTMDLAGGRDIHLQHASTTRNRLVFQSAVGSLRILTDVPTDKAEPRSPKAGEQQHCSAAQASLYLDLSGFNLQIDCHCIENASAFNSMWFRRTSVPHKAPPHAPSYSQPPSSPLNRPSDSAAAYISQSAGSGPEGLRFLGDDGGDVGIAQGISGVGGSPRDGRIKPRLVLLDVSIKSSSGKCEIYPRGHDLAMQAGGNNRGQSAAGGAGKHGQAKGGDLLVIPIPQACVAAEGHILFTGDERVDIEWISPEKVRVDDMEIALRDSMVVCVLTMPRDSYEISLSPPLLDFALDSLSFLRPQHKPHQHHQQQHQYQNHENNNVNSFSSPSSPPPLTTRRNSRIGSIARSPIVRVASGGYAPTSVPSYITGKFVYSVGLKALRITAKAAEGGDRHEMFASAAVLNIKQLSLMMLTSGSAPSYLNKTIDGGNNNNNNNNDNNNINNNNNDGVKGSSSKGAIEKSITVHIEGVEARLSSHPLGERPVHHNHDDSHIKLTSVCTNVLYTGGQHDPGVYVSGFVRTLEVSINLRELLKGLPMWDPWVEGVTRMRKMLNSVHGTQAKFSRAESGFGRARSNDSGFGRSRSDESTRTDGGHPGPTRKKIKMCFQVGSWSVATEHPLGITQVSSNPVDPVTKRRKKSLFVSVSHGVTGTAPGEAHDLVNSSVVSDASIAPSNGWSYSACVKDVILDCATKKGETGAGGKGQSTDEGGHGHGGWHGLEGWGSMESAYLQSTCGVPTRSGGVPNLAERGWLAGTRMVQMGMSFDEAKFLVLHVDQAVLSSVKEPADSSGISHTRAFLRYKNVLIRVCAETAPTGKRIVQRIAQLFPAKNKLSRRLSERTIRRNLSVANSLQQEDEDAVSESASGKESEKEGAVAGLVYGELVITGEELHFSLYGGGDISDNQECCQISVETLQLQLEQSKREHDIYKFLVAELSRALIFKIGQSGGAKGLPPPEHFTVAKMLDKPRLFRASSIFKIPQAHLDMSTIQTAAAEGMTLSPLVHCEFDTSFDEPLEITLDKRLYSFLLDLASRFQTHDTSRMYSPEAKHHSRMAAAGGGGKGLGRRSKQARDYRCLFFKLEPQISVLQEVTPDVVTILGYLGIHRRETIIAAVHGGVIDNLEKLLVALSRLS